MKILALSDHVADTVYSPNVRERFSDVDLLLSCGDLPYSYLEYTVTLLGVPAYYVHGNHDRPEYTDSGKTLKKPGGWVNVDEKAIYAKDLLIAGFEGSPRYKPDAPFQYTEKQMRHKVVRMIPALISNRVRFGRYVDILITHAPPRGIHDGEDLPHRGFQIFRWFMERFRPRYLLHGHKHVYRPETTRTRYKSTTVVNVYPFTVIEI